MAKTPFLQRRTKRHETVDLLLRFSEWLDADEKLMKKPKKKDRRTHEDLAKQFLAEVLG
ncbi:hypothetical protein [Mycolicibacterium houstonense]|uniref:hypothetical protein n=1 Tax=Mycolicibacterium houstonense TaxID=146021 RepID=UPI00135CCC4C|nr:hypothetical protein [Mycolicibacterium houstonense]